MWRGSATDNGRGDEPDAGIGMHHGVERAKGIEPSYAAWEAAVLPLNYARDRPSLADLAPSAKRSVSRSRFTVNFQKFQMRSQADAMIPSGLVGV